MSKLPYILGGAAVLAIGGGAAYYFLRKRAEAQATGLPAGAKGGYFWQSPDGSPKEAASLAELRSSVLATYGAEGARAANVLFPGEAAWHPAPDVFPAAVLAQAPRPALPPPLPPAAPPRYIPARDRVVPGLTVAPPPTSFVRPPIRFSENFDPSGITPLEGPKVVKRTELSRASAPATMGTRWGGPGAEQMGNHR